MNNVLGIVQFDYDKESSLNCVFEYLMRWYKNTHFDCM